jgi:putative MATE family efflux protein
MKQNDLTKGSIKKAVRLIAIPSSIGFLFNTLFNVVDTYFAGQLSVSALAGLTVSFPIFLITIALASGIGNGATALAAIGLGKKDKGEYHNIAKNALFLSIVTAIILVLIAPFAIPGLLALAGAEGETFANGLAYMNIVIYGAIFQILNFSINGLLSAQGNSRPFRNFLIIGFFLNIFLDPLFIFGWFGLPALGTAGVAIATVIVQAVGSVYLLISLIRSSGFDMVLFKQAKINRNHTLDLLKQSIPVALNTATVSIGIFIIQYFIYRFGSDETIAGYGAALRVEQIALLPTIGLNIATVAIVGQNFGAQRFDRIRQTIKQVIKYSFITLSIGLLIFYSFAPQLVGLFNTDPLVIAEGVNYLRIEGLAIYSYSLIGIASSVLQAIKKPYYALIIGIIRQLFPFIMFYLLGEVMGLGVSGIWWGIVIINYGAVALAWSIASNLLGKSEKVTMNLQSV